ncbi:PREDICTED: F-box protein At3g54460 [Tarenaya hassleriana]|uniref:F-box protein At3g54460 n=1 Tax=Tarenaya hassleriana TaxID=28532 RepID=UPI00053C1823|nr:PREDICTED: F-box protein At3g54460 [Tarenaya hassleriana]
MADGGEPDHKLCGFLCAVVSVNSRDLPHDLSVGSSCLIFSYESRTGFKTDNGVILSLIDSNSNINSRFRSSNGVRSPGDEAATMDVEAGALESSPKCERITEGERSWKSTETQKSQDTGRVRKRGRSIGMVNGSISVVKQIQALDAHNCLKIMSRVVSVDKGDNGEYRAVVLVDVLVPVALWCGWQFPKSPKIAASLFKHLSCDWKLRSSILKGESYWKESNGSIKDVWNISDCHVLGCKLCCGAYDSSKRKLFNLHEIFQSLPSPGSNGMLNSTGLSSSADSYSSGIWDLSDDILISILQKLSPKDLISVSGVCHHLRSLTSLIVPCLKLKLFPHQQAAVKWMLQREQKAEVLSHPLYQKFDTEDGFCFYVNVVSGDIVSEAAPTFKDFRGGMFCDEPGLGKTITALSLILKTQGTMADPPDGIPVIWCKHNDDEKCAYYEYASDQCTSSSMFSAKRVLSPSGCRTQFSPDVFSPVWESSSLPRKQAKLMDPSDRSTESEVQRRRSLGNVRKNLFQAYDGVFKFSNSVEAKQIGDTKKHGFWNLKKLSSKEQDVMKTGRKRKGPTDLDVQNETWIQCDACTKWRRILDEGVSVFDAAWFCSMNTDPEHQHCEDPEELWDSCQLIKYLQGFYAKGTSGEKGENVSFFTAALREHKSSINSMAKKALMWLADLPPDKLSQMETVGLLSPVLGSYWSKDIDAFQRIFQAFGLVKRVEKGVTRWYYPSFLDNLVFDLPALRVALCQPLDTFRLYLSKASLIVVPANLVDHWKTQIKKHVSPGQLRVLIWTDNRKPSAHSLAWDYDVVITTFNRLSAEWSPRKKSPLMQVHWLRVMLDEGHTLGCSLSLTNKFQMAISLTACNRWLLTGTPTPNTPNSQLLHLQPLLRFLQEEVYGENLKFWESGIHRPFEAEMEEGRLRLLELLQRCMISARKKDLLMIPPCIKKVTYLSFTQEHARSYNELVETVRRNVLLADWNDPSHVESLLNPKQWKFRSATIRNLRLSCCVSGHIKMTDAGQDIKETMDDLVKTGLDPSLDEYSLINSCLLSGCNCQRCREWCRLPVITPCRHLLCLDCVALDSERCNFPGCGCLFEMQTPLARPENPNPKWAVPRDLIELQPSYKQDDWNPDWHSTMSSKVAYLVGRLRKLQESNRKNILSFCKTNSRANFEQDFNSLGFGAWMGLVDKVLIFSQFLEHINVIEQQLIAAGIKFAGMYSPMHSANKMKSLATFQQDHECMALVMDGTTALGLDLSFVTQVFLMEPIWDKSMEEQVISRAHRMGATRPIHVETLTMRGTIEEQMMRFLEDAEKRGGVWREEQEKPDKEKRNHRSMHDFAGSNYLVNLGFVRTDVIVTT